MLLRALRLLLACTAMASLSAQAEQEIVIQAGHAAGITGAAYTPDGARVVTASRDATLRLWEVATGREIRSFTGHNGAILGLAMLPDGRRVASAATDRSVRLWDLETGQEIKRFDGHQDWVNRVAASPDGRLLAAAGGDSTVRVWDIDSGREVARLQGHEDHVTALAFSPDGAWLASGSIITKPGPRVKMVLWRTRDWNRERTLYPQPDPVAKGNRGIADIAFSPDSRRVALAVWGLMSSENLLRIYDVASGEVLHTTSAERGFLRVAWAADGRTLAVGNFDGLVHVHDGASGSPLKQLKGHASWITALVFAPDSHQLLSASADQTARLWSLASGTTTRQLKGAPLPKTALTLVGERIVVGGRGDTLQVWNGETGKLERLLAGTPGAQPDFSRGDGSGPQYVGRGEGGEFGAAMQRQQTGWRNFHFNPGARISAVAALAASSDGKWLFSADKSFHLRRIPAPGGGAQGELEFSGPGHSGYITSLALSADNRLLVSGGADRSVILWDAVHGTRLREMAGATPQAFGTSTADSGLGDVQAVAISPDGRRIAAALWNNRVRIWDAASGTLERELKRNRSENYWALAFSPDGATLATGDTQQITLWDVATGRELRALNGHQHYVIALAFHPDGQRLISSSFDTTVRLWDLKTGQDRLLPHASGVAARVAVSRSGTRIVAAGIDGGVRLWTGDGERLLATLVSFTDGEWVAVTPRGHFNASPNGARWLNVRRDNRIAGLEQYFDAFFRPDYVTLALQDKRLADPPPIAESRPEPAASAPLAATVTPPRPTAPAAPAVPAIAAAPSPPVPAVTASVATAPTPPPAKRPASALRLEAVKPPPRVALGELPATSRDQEIALPVHLTDAGGGIGEVRVFLNGVAVLLDGTRNLAVATAGERRSYRLRLGSGENLLRVIAFNADNTMQSDPVEHRIVTDFAAARRPVLHALIIGIQEFDNPVLALRYSVADADLFAATLQRHSRGLFQEVRITKLTSRAETTKDSILAALDRLRAQVGPDDLFAFYVASHGTVDDGEYFLISSNVGGTSTARLRRDAISQDELKGRLANIPATKKFIVLDTCNAGRLGDALQVAMLTRGMSEDTAMKILSRAMGSTILSAATSQQEALEGYQGHGLFTWVIAQGLGGAADTDRDGFVKTTELADYVDNEVPELAERIFKRKQYPVISPTGQAFPLVQLGK